MLFLYNYITSLFIYFLHRTQLVRNIFNAAKFEFSNVSTYYKKQQFWILRTADKEHLNVIAF